MKISLVEISKFRSVESGNFSFDNITAIVGQNNSGKSTIMRALNSFFNPKEELIHYINETNLYTTKRTIPRITITFNSVPNNSIYSSHIFNGSLTIKQEYNKQKRKLDYYVVKNGTSQMASEELIDKLLVDVQFVLIPTDRNARHRGDEKSVLRTLLDTFFATHTEKRDTLSPKVKDAFKYLKKNALSKVANGIEELYLANKGFKIEIDSRYPLNYELFLNDLAIKIIEDDQDFKLEECGSGVQSLVAISIYRYLANLNHTNYIIGIEEPEINLHPQAQKELIFALLDEVNNNDLQILFTTHSTVLIDELDHTKIVLVRKEIDEKRSFKTTIHQLQPDFWNNYNIQVLQYDKFHKFRNSEFFFSNHVIVTESPTDSEVFRNLLKQKGIVIERHGISVLELSGISSLKYAFYLLRDLNIPKTMIIDKDFFFNYRNGDKDNSRYGSGFFNYSTTFKNEILITEILNNPTKRTQIEGLLTSNHSKALDLTLEFDVLCMKYNMEMDLVASNTACNLIYNKLSIPTADRNTNNLLTNYENGLKKLKVLLHVIENTPHQNLPNSYKRLIKRFKEIVK
jgi:putative ATP-dependent endonuclease of the OLD family